MNEAVLIKGDPSSDRNIPFWHIIILLSAFLNAALRPDIDSDITLFRIVLPIILIYIVINDKIAAKNLFIIISLFTILQSISFTFSPYELSYINIVVYANYLVMFAFSIYIYIISNKFGRSSLDSFITLYIYALIFFSFMQYYYGIQVINVQERSALNSWYGNENDASLTLTAFIFYRCRFGLSWKTVPAILSAIIIIWYNGSRTCLLMLSIIPFYLVYKNYGWIYLSALIALLIVSVTTLLGITGSLNDSLKDVSKFLMALYQGLIIIFDLKVVPGVISSVDVRSMAAVLAIIDFLDYPLFGTGAGNTYALVDNNSSIFNGVISSIHNMPLMIAAETGIVGSLFIILALKSMSRIPLWSFLFWLSILSLASISAAGGFIVNYFVLMILIIIVSTPLEGRSCNHRLFPNGKSDESMRARAI